MNHGSVMHICVTQDNTTCCVSACCPCRTYQPQRDVKDVASLREWHLCLWQTGEACAMNQESPIRILMMGWACEVTHDVMNCSPAEIACYRLWIRVNDIEGFQQFHHPFDQVCLPDEACSTVQYYIELGIVYRWWQECCKQALHYIYLTDSECLSHGVVSIWWRQPSNTDVPFTPSPMNRIMSHVVWYEDNPLVSRIMLSLKHKTMTVWRCWIYGDVRRTKH